MFAGIVENESEVKKIRKKDGSLFLTLKKPASWKIKEGESLAVNGVCSTIRSFKGKELEVEYMPETLAKTAVKYFKKGTIVNLERSLRFGDRISGHLIQGHVDSIGRVAAVRMFGRSKILKIKFPQKFVKFAVEKGSIGVNGVSLTVSKINSGEFEVSLVEYTLKNTNLGRLRKGDLVNIEFDLISKYLNSLIKK